ncbi:RNA polymerase sigma factor [Zafaria sp. Z1313]|uniref:RNA polymerase sigma factor n=1 Tax=Zafaria sp. Z1313 TaxID=3423202 RepID=UPI003D3020D3
MTAEFQHPAEQPVPDDALASRVRAGDPSAAAVLAERHRAAALAVARTHADDDAGAQALAEDALGLVLRSERDGLSPPEFFRGRWCTAVARLGLSAADGSSDPHRLFERGDAHADRVMDLHEARLLANAFRSLPPRQQAALWLVEVEGRDERAAAPLLAVTREAAAAVTAQAREGLAAAYAQSHLALSADPACGAALGPRPAGGPTGPEGLRSGGRRPGPRGPEARGSEARERGEACPACRWAFELAGDPGPAVRRVVVPLFLGAGTAGHLVVPAAAPLPTRAGAAAAVRGPARFIKDNAVALGLAVAAALTAAAVATAGVLPLGDDDGARPGAGVSDEATDTPGGSSNGGGTDGADRAETAPGVSLPAGGGAGDGGAGGGLDDSAARPGAETTAPGGPGSGGATGPGNGGAADPTTGAQPTAPGTGGGSTVPSASEPGGTGAPSPTRTPGPSPTASTSGTPSSSPTGSAPADPSTTPSGTPTPTESDPGSGAPPSSSEPTPDPTPTEPAPEGPAIGGWTVTSGGGGNSTAMLFEPEGGFAPPMTVTFTVRPATVNLIDVPLGGAACTRTGVPGQWRCLTDGRQTLQFGLTATGSPDGGSAELSVEVQDDAGRGFSGTRGIPVAD